LLILFASNYGQGVVSNFVYVTAFQDGAVLAAEMAVGDMAKAKQAGIEAIN